MRTPTSGPHFFTAVEGGTAWLGGDDSHHLTRVLRAQAGDPVSLADGAGGVFQARVAELSPKAVRLEVTQRWDVPAPEPRLTVVHALPKARKLDDVVQRLCEVGVDRVVPVSSARSEVKLDDARAAKAVDRWRAVALAAAKQSRRARVMEVAELATWQAALADVRGGVILWEEEEQVPLRHVLERLTAEPELVLAIGPEGGLTADEASAGGLPTASLGDTVLRTETAALVAASITLSTVGRLG